MTRIVSERVAIGNRVYVGKVNGLRRPCSDLAADVEAFGERVMEVACAKASPPPNRYPGGQWH